MVRRKTLEEVKYFIENVIEEWGNLSLLSTDYENSRKTLLLMQTEKGFLFEMTLQDIGLYLRKKLKPKLFSNKNKYTFHNITLWVKNNEPTYRLVSTEFTGINNELKFLCPEGHDFKMDLHHFKNHGNRCPYCAGRFKDMKFLNSRIRNIHGDLYRVIGKYIRNHDHTEVLCNKCNQTWMITPSNLLRGHGCPRCKQSKGNKAIAEYLILNKIKYNAEVKFNDCRNKRELPFDISIKNKTILIEFDGKQHFYRVDHFGGEKGHKKTKVNDQIKNTYCIKNNIPLIRIPYWEQQNIEYIMNNVLIHFGLIENKENTYDKEIVLKYLVDENWNHDEYISWADNHSQLKRRDV